MKRHLTIFFLSNANVQFMILLHIFMYFKIINNSYIPNILLTYFALHAWICTFILRNINQLTYDVTTFPQGPGHRGGGRIVSPQIFPGPFKKHQADN